MFKFIYDLITDPLGLPIEWYYEWLILLIIDRIAYLVAYDQVGMLYHGGAISGKSSGSFFHWIIRAFLFLIMWAVVYATICLGKFVISHKLEVGIVVAVVIGLIIVGKGVICYMKQNKFKQSIKLDQDTQYDSKIVMMDRRKNYETQNTKINRTI